jgi:lipoyl(octanoyl) transferase
VDLTTRPIDVRRLGVVPYDEGVAVQQQFVDARRAGAVPDQLLLLQHPPVITLGVKARNDRSHVLATPELLAEQGVAVFESGRGGDVTYHGPGQLVGYPILDLKPDRADVHRYVRDLEQVLIDAVAQFGVTGRRIAGLSGVWVGDEGREKKVAAIGIRISRWITSHGFALNVNTTLAHFRHIVPCGIADRGVTSLEEILSRRLALADVEDAVAQAFAKVFTGSVHGGGPRPR